tara:strand:- start:219 stop:425 length:207 start_codon:yes stop_codon:yes gene_type:complete
MMVNIGIVGVLSLAMAEVTTNGVTLVRIHLPTTALLLLLKKEVLILMDVSGGITTVAISNGLDAMAMA